MSQLGERGRSRVRVEQWFAALMAVELPIFLRSLVSCIYTSVDRIGTGHRQVSPGIQPDLCCLHHVAATSGWAEVNTRPVTHGGCYHVTEAAEPYGLWDSRWRLSFKISRSMWNYSRYSSCCRCRVWHITQQWHTQEFCSGGGGVQQIQLRTEDRENGDLGEVAS
jgi:hypothetical protein